MQVNDVGAAGDELRVTRMGGDETVEALPQVADGDRPRRGRTAHRQVKFEQVRVWIVGREPRVPTGAWPPFEHRLVAIVADWPQFGAV